MTEPPGPGPEQELARFLAALFAEDELLHLVEAALGDAAAARLPRGGTLRDLAGAAARLVIQGGRGRELLAHAAAARPDARLRVFQLRCHHFPGWDADSDVFLGFNASDLEEAAVVTRRLEDAGLMVALDDGVYWSDEETLTNYLSRARSAIARGRCLLVLFGEEDAAIPEWRFWSELRDARARGQPTLLGVVGRVGDGDLPHDVADEHLDLRVLSRRRPSAPDERRAALEALTEAVLRRVGGTRRHPPPWNRPARGDPAPSHDASWWTRPTSARRIRGLGLALVVAGLATPWAAWAGGWLDASALPSQSATPEQPATPVAAVAPTPAPKKDLVAEAAALRPALLLVPAGTFTMGSPDGEGDADEHPAHQVTLPSFLVCETEVTQAHYKAVMGTSPSLCSSDGEGCGDDYPVNISWNDACAYMNRLTLRENTAATADQPALTPCYVERSDTWEWRDRACTGYRLPTEAEWEYAARAGTGGTYSFKGGEDVLGKYAWFGEGFDSYAHPVGEKLPNPWGLFDIHGNVWEWCWDWFDPGWYAKKKDASSDMSFGPDSGEVRVLRGGSVVNGARSLRSAWRNHNPDLVGSRFIGIRCVRSSSSSLDR